MILRVYKEKQISKICPFITILHFYISKPLKINGRSTNITVDASCTVYITIFLWSKWQHCCMCGTENNRGAVANELWLWAKTNRRKNRVKVPVVFLLGMERVPEQSFSELSSSPVVRIISTPLSDINIRVKIRRIKRWFS